MNRINKSRAQEEAVANSGLLDNYVPIEGMFDEMADSASVIRPHWEQFVEQMRLMGPREWRKRQETAQRLVRENGTTYNVYDDHEDSSRPWRMDPVPLLIASGEWARLEAGLIQRATLLNAIAADIYGPQRLLTGSLLPPSLVLGNQDFLRPLHGVETREGVYLHFLAMDLVRAADDKWWVLSDRTQAPSGAGYALENRVVMTRALPNLFRDAHVHRLARFFQSFSDRLVQLTGRDDPLIVLMTPGPYNETYFEHAYLARYLGFPLVEGADLTVRDNKVYLKTLDGLKQVDLIFRRVDAEFCDPLELRTDSMLGVAGLVAAVRTGNVVVANALGSAILECEAIMSFLPSLCRQLIGEDLAIPSVATWWCGQQLERNYVKSNLDRLVIRRTFSNSSIFANSDNAIYPSELSQDELEKLIARIDRRGYDYIGQEVLSLSTTPVWRDDGLQPRPMTLRVYLAWDGDTYRVMAGGLTRTSDDHDTHAVSMQQGDASKDTWVLSDEPVSTFSRLQPADQELTFRRGSSDLPSRVADNLFWLGRYAERTENTVRLMRSLILRLAGEAGTGDDAATLHHLTRILVDFGYLRPRTGRRAAARGIRAVEREMSILLFDPACPSGLLNLLDNLKRTASLVRERLSVDAWRILNTLYDLTRRHAVDEQLDVSGALALLNEMAQECSGFSGMQQENMTRSIGWRLLDFGRRAERGGHMARLMRELTVEGDPEAEGSLDLLLELGDSSMTYRTRYLSTVQLPAVLDLLLVDETNPRSVAYQVAAIEEHMSALPRADNHGTLSAEQRLVIAAASELKLCNINELCRQHNARGRRVALEKFLRTQEQRILEISDNVARIYFTHALPTRSGSVGGIIQ
jgi:uncharacterized circularly permuted ATP-grasp superfamily protein/uncharacterized alpha-E superfamily protein